MSVDLRKLVFATFRIYKDSLLEAWKGLFSSWKYLLYHIALLLICALAIPLVSLIGGGFVGGFMLGFLLAYLVACYLSTVEAGLRQDKLTFKEMFSEGGQLFSPVISFLFTFFVLSFLFRPLVTASNLWMLKVLNLLICVFFNPAPEVISTRPGLAMGMFKECYEFIVENFVEWFFPTLLVLLPMLIYSPSLFLNIRILLLTNNPLAVIQSFIIGASNFGVILTGGLLIIPFGIGAYFIFLFRLSLFRKLSTSTRRKRVYQYGN